MRISELTRRNIIDTLSIEGTQWWGRLDEIDFLQRVFDLSQLPSTDGRFKNAAGDIFQHRVNNNDWDDDWVFYDHRFNLLHCEDETFLRFLCEMLHPVVRADATEVERLRQNFNEMLRPDGYQVVERSRLSGRPVFAATVIEAVAGPLNAAKQHFDRPDMHYVIGQITRMESAINEAPDLAIGTAKELVESVCKVVLEDFQIDMNPEWDLVQLARNASEQLTLTPKNISNEAKASATIKRILGNLANITQGIAELRNECGTGHGKSPSMRGLQPRHAKLAAHAASTLAVFLMETFEEQKMRKAPTRA